MDSVAKETHVVSVLTKWLVTTVAVARDEKDYQLDYVSIQKNCEKKSCRFWHLLVYKLQV